MSTKQRSLDTDNWVTCLSERKIESLKYKVLCEKPTSAKELKISLGGDARLYLHEVIVVGIVGEYGLSFVLGGWKAMKYIYY